MFHSQETFPALLKRAAEIKGDKPALKARSLSFGKCQG